MKTEDVKIGMEVRGVECVNNSENHVKVGELYKIVSRSYITDLVDFKDKDGATYCADVKRFEPATDPTPEFKIGDSVRCIENMGQRQLNVGEIYEITGIQEKGENVFVNGNTNGNAGFFPRRFELKEQEFQKGDRVRVTNLHKKSIWYSKSKEQFIGMEFTVTDVAKYTVELDTGSTEQYVFIPEWLEHVDIEPNHRSLIGIDWTGEEATPIIISTYGGGCQHHPICNEENQKSSRYGPNHCHKCKEAGRYLRIQEVKDMKEETLNEVCKQLNIGVVGKDSGSLILKDERIGNIVERGVSLTLTQAEQKQLISKLPPAIKNRAFILSDSELSFTSYEFVENPDPKSDVVEEVPSE